MDISTLVRIKGIFDNQTMPGSRNSSPDHMKHIEQVFSSEGDQSLAARTINKISIILNQSVPEFLHLNPREGGLSPASSEDAGERILDLLDDLTQNISLTAAGL